MNKTYTLIVWEENPEKIRFFLVPNSEVNEAMAVSLKEANGVFMNTRGWNKNKGLLAVNKFLFNDEGECIRPDLEVESSAGKLVLDNGKFSEENSGIVRVCHTGIVL